MIDYLSIDSDCTHLAHYPPNCPLVGEMFSLLLALDVPLRCWPHYFVHCRFITRQFQIPVFQVERKYFSRFHEFRLMSRANRKLYAAVGDKAFNDLERSRSGITLSRQRILGCTARLNYNHYLSGMNSEMQADVHEACFSLLSPQEQRVFFSRYFS